MDLIWATPDLDDFTVGEWDVIFATLAEHGFSGVEPLISQPYKLKVSYIQELLESHNLQIYSFRTGGIVKRFGVDFNAPTAEARSEAVGRLKDVITYATEFASPNLVIGWLQGLKRQDQLLEEVQERVAASLSVCENPSRNNSVQMLLEPLNKNEMNYHNTCNEVVDFLEYYGLSSVRMVIDSYHMAQEEENVQDAIRIAGTHLDYVHLADEERKIPGAGRFDFEELFVGLHDIGYQGSFGVEINDSDILASIRNTKQFLDLFLT